MSAGARSRDRDGLRCALDLVGEKWTLLILQEALAGATRFDDIVMRLGVSRKVLAERLAMLVKAGLMTKEPYQAHPVRYDYRLTARAEALSGVIGDLEKWGEAARRCRTTGSALGERWSRTASSAAAGEVDRSAPRPGVGDTSASANPITSTSAQTR